LFWKSQENNNKKKLIYKAPSGLNFKPANLDFFGVRKYLRLCSRLTALWRYINFILLLLLLSSGMVFVLLFISMLSLSCDCYTGSGIP